MEQKSLTRGIVCAIIVAVVIGGVYLWGKHENSKLPVSVEPLEYAADNELIRVSKNTVPVDYTGDQLLAMMQECGNTQTQEYADALAATFTGVNKTVYNFAYTGDSQEPNTFAVTLVPNKAAYSSLNAFKKDFDQCVAGGDAYPSMLNDAWLLFVNSCGSGTDDGSEKQIGCEAAREIIEPTLRLK